jgi:hypothetical protein
MTTFKRIATMVLFGMVAASSGCAGLFYSPMTAAEVREHGTRRYAHLPPDKVTQACATALDTLGYRVTVSRVGLVKTAPKVVMTSASGSYGYATATEDSLAWTVSVRTVGPEAVVVAQPRGYRNGTEMVGERVWTAQILDPKLHDLWRELDGNLEMTGRPIAKKREVAANEEETD